MVSMIKQTPTGRRQDMAEAPSVTRDVHLTFGETITDSRDGLVLILGRPHTIE